MIKKETKLLVFLSFIISCVVFVACNQPTTGKVQNQNEGNNNNSAKVSAPYPHPKSFALPTQHGEQYLKLNDEDKVMCIKCHSGQKTSVAMSCNTCHNSFPHAEGYMKPSNHKTAAYTNEGKCASCHKGGESNPINTKCFMCHAGDMKTEVHWKEPEASPSPTGAPAQTPKASLKSKKPQRYPSNK